MAARRNVLDEIWFFSYRGKKDIAFAVAGKIRHHTTGIALAVDGGKKVPRINFNRVYPAIRV